MNNFADQNPEADIGISVLADTLSGAANLLRLGQGTYAAHTAQNNYDAAIGILQDVERAAGITVLVGGALHGMVGEPEAPRPTSCFAAGTKVSTPDGDINIEDIRAGD